MKHLKLASALCVGLALAGVSRVCAQGTSDPFTTPINATADVIAVNYTEFATIPDTGGEAPRMMMMVDEPGTRRLFVSDDARADLQRELRRQDRHASTSTSTTRSGTCRSSRNFSERGVQSFAFHPQFNQRGRAGYGKFYTYIDTQQHRRRRPTSCRWRHGRTHDTVLLEWTAKNPAAADLRRRRAARTVPRRSSRSPTTTAARSRFNPLAAGQQPPISACSTSASPTAAAAAIR